MRPSRGNPMKLFVSGLLAFAFSAAAFAHHSVLHYDGKVEIKITGVVTAARFGFPHSVYRIDVTDEEGAVEQWVLSTEDPRDAERLGFRDEIESIKVGDSITVVGWPHKFNDREIRGHQLHYPDGRIVMMRRGNYIWPQDILRLDRYVQKPETIEGHVQDIDPSLPFDDQVILWIEEGDHIARVAYEVIQNRARLIGVSDEDGVVFAGVGQLLECHTWRDDFTMIIEPANFDEAQLEVFSNGREYISEFNRVLSRWWEQERSSCE